MHGKHDLRSERIWICLYWITFVFVFFSGLQLTAAAILHPCVFKYIRNSIYIINKAQRDLKLFYVDVWWQKSYKSQSKVHYLETKLVLMLDSYTELYIDTFGTTLIGSWFHLQKTFEELFRYWFNNDTFEESFFKPS